MCIVFVLDLIFRPENSGREKIDDRHNSNECVLCIVFVLDGIFRPENESEQYMCIAFVLDGKFRPECEYNTNTTKMNVYCICIGRNIPAGK